MVFYTKSIIFLSLKNENDTLLMKTKLLERENWKLGVIEKFQRMGSFSGQ